MKEKLKHNLLLKILSLAIAFALWLIVINIDDPVDTKDFYNIKVNLLNSSSITDQNKVYEVLDNSAVVRRVTVEAPRKLLESLSASDIVAEADFEKVTVNETIEIEFYSTRSNDEIRNITGSTGMVKLNIENKKNKRLSLVATTAGKPAEGYIVGNVTLDQNRLEVSGPESVVSRIVSAGLQVDISDSNSDISTYADVVLYDAAGKEISQETLTMNTDSVKVKVPILATKTVPVEYNIAGVPAEGYLWTGEVIREVESVTIAGYESVLNSITSIKIPDTVLDLTGLEADLIKTVDLDDYLPGGINLVGGFNGRMEITLPIEKEQQRQLEIPVERIYFQGVPAGLTAQLSEDILSYNVTVYGLRSELNTIQQAQVYGLVQITDLMADLELEELVPGTYEAEVVIDFAEGIEQKEPLMVNVIISEVETEY